MTRAHIFFSGMVQGVGFRYMARQFAHDLGLVGWVKNLPDGRVEVLVEGKKDTIENLVRQLREHFGSYVRKTDVDYHPAQNQFQDFRIAF